MAVVFDSEISDNVTGAKLYVDGRKKGIGSEGSKIIDTAYETPVRIGLGLTTRYFKGAIDDLQIYSYALSDNSIREQGSWLQVHLNFDHSQYGKHENL